MLEVKNLFKSYGSLEVLKGINFTIESGKVYGFLGQNGSGKTTTMNIMTGLMDFQSGEILLDGKELLKNKQNSLKKIGYLPQSPVFYGYMNAHEYLNFIGEISGMSKAKIKSRTEEVLKIVNLEGAAKRKVGEYSGGMVQRFGLAVAMFNSPEILILDEPTSALDPEGRMEILELILKLKAEGKSIFLSSHILNDIERVCDEISILNEGKIILSGELDKLMDEYIKPIYDVEFDKECGEISEALKSCSYVEKVNCEKNKASIYVKDVAMAKNKLLSFLVSFNNPVISFNLRKSTLEDIFIRLVSKNVNI